MNLNIELIRRIINKYRDKWRWAKTYESFAPHEYLLLKDIEEKDKWFFQTFAKYIVIYGYKKRFYSKVYNYININGYKYWFTNDEKGSYILNREKIGGYSQERFINNKTFKLLKKSKTMRKIFLLLLPLLLLLTSCTDQSVEIHEWGVMDGCSNEFLATSRPEIDLIVKQPVIYLHGNISWLEARVNGSVLITYPEAIRKGNVLRWEIGNEKTTLLTKRLEHVPLALIMDKLRAGNEKRVINGVEESFIYYEFSTNYEPKIIVNNGYIFNLYDEPIKNIFIVKAERDSLFNYKNYVAYIPLLKEKEKIPDFKEVDDNVRKILLEDLLESGLTLEEANSFIDLWYKTFFNSPRNRIIYVFPNKEYEKIVSLRADKPLIIKRRIYLITDYH